MAFGGNPGRFPFDPGMFPFFPPGVFPPQHMARPPDFVLGILFESILQKKQEAEEALKKEHLHKALSLYTEALTTAENTFPGHVEIPKLLCNRALIYIKQEKFREALADASRCCDLYPGWIKGYWRSAQALKGLKENYSALIKLTDGLSFCLGDDIHVDEQVTLFSELIITILLLSDDPGDHLDQIDAPEDISIQIKILQRLASNGHWEGVSLLVIGKHVGPISCLDASFSDCPAQSIVVAPLVTDLSLLQMKKWGLQLLMALLKNGASYKDLEYKVGKPAIHIGVELSLKTGSTELLKLMFKQYLQTEDTKNAMDQKNDSAFHLLVHSGKTNETIGESILRILVNNGCNPHVKDASNKRPVDYVSSEDLAYSILNSAQKLFDEDIKKKLQKLKEDGNKAHRDGDNGKAITAYSAAIQLFETKNLPKEQSAVFLTNRSAVYSAIGNIIKALQDADESVKRDPNWHKGHWRRGQLLRQQCNHLEAYLAFLEGFINTQATAGNNKINFLVEACISFSLIKGVKEKVNFYERLECVPKDDTWQLVLFQLSKQGEWSAIRFVILGVHFDFAKEVPFVTAEGIAAYVKSSITRLQMSTIIAFIRKHFDQLNYLRKWIMPLVFFIVTSLPQISFSQNYKSHFIDLSEDDEDTPLNGLVKFCALIGDITILKTVDSNYLKQWKFKDVNGNTPFHAMYKMTPRPSADGLLKVTQYLFTQGFSVNSTDTVGNVPLHYLSAGDGELYRLVQKSTSSMKQTKTTINTDPAQLTLDVVLKLKESGNEAFKMGRYPEAIQHYSDAISALQYVNTSENKGHHFAVLYGNRSECHLKLGNNSFARNDAVESVSYDGHWYKSHFRVGKAQAACGNFDTAFKAVVNSYDTLKREESENVRREILCELTKYAQKINSKEPIGSVQGKLSMLKNAPGQLWAKVTYDLISIHLAWKAGQEAYQQFKYNEAKVIRCQVDLKPLCNLDELEKGNVWVIDLICFFLVCGSDHTTLSLQRTDTYLHAVVRMSLASGCVDLLEYIVNNIVYQNNDHNIVDSKGNTALHIATRETRVRINTHSRLRVCVILIRNTEINTLQKNNDGKIAIQYLPEHERDVAQILVTTMSMQSDMEKQMKKQNREQQDSVRRNQQEMERKKREDLEKRKREESKKSSTYSQRTATGRSFEQERRPKKGPMKKPSQENQNHCQGCQECFENGEKFLDENKAKAYSEFARILQKKHQSPQHKDYETKVLNILIQSMSRVLNPEIPERLVKIPAKLYEKLVAGLAKAEKYRQLDIAVQEYRKQHGKLALADYAKSLSIAKVIRCGLVQDQQLVMQIVKNMLDSGGGELEKDGKLAVLGALQEEQFKVLEVLFKKGASPIYLTLVPGDTPMHAALLIALERDKGNFALLNLFFEMFEENCEKYSMLDPSSVDKNGDCLFHVVARAKYSATAQKATEMLCGKKVSAMVYNNEGKLPKDYLNHKNDRRLQFFRLASVRGVEDKVQPKRSRDKISPDLRPPEVQEKQATPTKTDDTENSAFPSMKKSPADGGKTERKQERVFLVKSAQRREAARSHIERMIYDMPDIPYSMFNPRQIGNIDEGQSRRLKQRRALEESRRKKEHQAQEEAAPKTDDQPTEMENEEEEEEEDEIRIEEEEDFQFDPQVFDNLEWEIECTSDVWRTLRDKHVLPDLKQRVIRKIQLLAKGEWRPHLCKEIRNIPETLKLYEAKLSKGGRILWELAVAFSPRLSETADRLLERREEDDDQSVIGGRIYSEVIRVWDIVFDHDKIYRSVQRIIKSHHRGEDCIIQKKLKGIKQQQFQGGVTKRIPMLYTEMNVDQVLREKQQELQQFFPPASSNETEYHILKFYTFSSNLVSHVLQNLEMKVDFPFRVTDLEHAIINLQSSAPILLLGRSGTGKTTCCLYRLWSQFLSYWTSASRAESKLLPRCIIFRQDPDNTDQKEKENAEDAEEEAMEDDEEIEEVLDFESDPANEDEEEDGSQHQYDHLQQLFVTKNAVLCSEVQKNFRELSHACDLANEHVALEAQQLPHRFQDVNEYQFPLFLTSRQLLLMLDATLQPPYFFERNEDGSMRVNVEGWSDNEGPLGFHPLIGEEDEEDLDEDVMEDAEENEDHEVDNEEPQHHRVRQRVDPRREVSYQIFAEEVWPHISKKFQKKYHPSLVWMEIMSFIKGSYEALSKPSGSLSLQEYLQLGKKRAPNFSGEREHIFKIFKNYEHALKQRFLFDETDLVRNVYTRLRKEESLKFVIHQIYVDETQDFTQAELCLLLNVCNNPNQMFLTGDTAQSIMRGISFRFNDLRSLFFYAKSSMHAVGKTSAIEVPKQVYQLIHNYRSHAGILSLASSILDLMIEFFPESFDRLGKDQGLFQGPAPVLLESCSFSDLALLLRGNKRKTSHIEFGAHQAILVVNDSARDSIPEELQLGLILTIYEAKGLEFDDILLYNFFQDSQACKEWRVVTEFLEKLFHSQQEATHQAANRQEVTSSLLEFDADVLQQTGRPRALMFDPNQHKVLNAELKHLYTAVTRARVNVWIFDEHEEKRAPMFEYFKARKLVRSITRQDVGGVSDSVFAEESTPYEWVRRGEDFMKHSLYEVAAKCFSRGGDEYMQSVALAHQQALEASRMKENPSKMREEYLYAAKMFLECELPSKAVICLQNSRDRELVAQLYEKIGQLEKAGETYRRIRKPLQSSRCYEQLGKFNLAVETLYENEMYNAAIDTLQRYKLLMKELKETGTGIPQILIHNKPHQYHSEEQLIYAAAKFYHNMKNTDKMMEALARMPTLEDQTNFLIKRDYIQEAAHLLEKAEQYEKASDLYLTRGMTADALECARKSGKRVLIGHALLIDSFIQVNKTKEQLDEENLEKICNNLETAFNIFQKEKLKDEAGRASLLRGQITGKRIFINKAFGAFEYAEPRNEAGQLECMHWMMENSTLHKDGSKVMNQVIKGMDNLFGILRILIKVNSVEEKQRAEKILMFYGFQLSEDRLNLVLCPQQYPMAVGMLKRIMSGKDRKAARCEIEKDRVISELCRYLIDRGHEWMIKIQEALHKMRLSMKQCPDFTLGRPCSQLKNEAAEDYQEDLPKSVKCPYLHEVYSQERHNLLLDVDELLIELSFYVQHGSQVLIKIGNTDVMKDLKLERFLPSNISERYKTCCIFLQDLLPDGGFPTVATDSSMKAKELKMWFKNRRKWFKEFFKQYLFESYEEMRKTERKWNTRVFVRRIFLFHLLDLKTCINKKPIETMTEFEIEVYRELQTRYNNDVGHFRKEKEAFSLGFMPETYKQSGKSPTFSIMCMSRRFYDAIDKLSDSNNDPGEALIQFSKFISMLSTKKDYVTLMPFYSDFLFWFEFFVAVSLSLIAKTFKGDSFFFVLPESYISEIHLVDASLTQVPTLEAIQRFRPLWTFRYDQFPLRLRNLTAILAGERNMNLLEDLFKIKNRDEKIKEENFGLAERVLVLTLVCLCNIGHGLLPDRERLLMRQLHRIRPNESYPPRLLRAIQAVHQATGQQDLALILTKLLKQKENEKLLHCTWTDKRYGICHKDLKVEEMNKDFFNEETLTCSSNLQTENAENSFQVEEDSSADIQEDLVITMEERMKREQQQKEIDKKEKDDKASRCISTFMKKIVIRKRCAYLKKLVKKEIEKEDTLRKISIFKSVEITEEYCGICGVSFVSEEEEKEDAGSQDFELSSNAEQQSGRKSLLDYFTRSSFLRQQSSSSQNPEGDIPRQLEKRIRHLESMTHTEKVKAQQIFRWKFMKDLSKDFFDISDFIDKFKLASKSVKYENHAYFIERMVRLQKEAREELRRIVEECDWLDSQKFVEKVKEMKSDYTQVHEYIKETAKSLKTSLEMKHIDGEANSRERYSPECWDDELEDVYEVVDDPKLRKPQSGKGRGRGRGRKKEK